MENMVAASNGRERDDENRRRMLRALKRAVKGELTPRQLQCVELYYGEKISQREIAKRLGMAPPTVCKHLKKARARLRRVLEYYF
jgi:RNA polymerase sigma factor (sigma-70 family)